MKLVQGRIEALGKDSRGVLHVHFRRGLRLYELWAVDTIADTIIKYHYEHGPLMEIAAKPIQLRFNDVTDEVIGIVFVDHSI
jgi:hypothetical protein